MTDKKKPTNIKSIRPDIVIEEDTKKEVDPTLLKPIQALLELVAEGKITEYVLVGVGNDSYTFRVLSGVSTQPFLLDSILGAAQFQLKEERIHPILIPELYEFIED